MNELESPYKLASFSAQSYDGVGPFVISGSQSTVIVRAGTSRRHKNQITLDVHSHDGPCVPCAAAPCFALALASRHCRIRRKRTPAPTQRAGASVISAYHAACHVHAVIVVNG